MDAIDVDVGVQMLDVGSLEDVFRMRILEPGLWSVAFGPRVSMTDYDTDLDAGVFPQLRSTSVVYMTAHVWKLTLLACDLHGQAKQRSIWGSQLPVPELARNTNWNRLDLPSSWRNPSGKPLS